MADTQIKDLDNLGANAAAADELGIYDSDASYDKRINISDLFTSLWALNQAFTLGAKLTAGASEIEGSNFDINGCDISAGTISGSLTWSAAQNLSSQALTNVNIDSGAIDGVTLGTNSAITNCQIDNININGNTISSTAGTDLLITPLAGQQIVLDGTIVIDAGVVTGATSITSTAIITTGNATVGSNLDVAGSTTIDKTLSIDGTPQDLAASGEIDADSGITTIRTGVGALAATIANGTTQGQIKYIFMIADGGGDATLSDGVLNATSIVFANPGEGCTLMWDNTNSKWNVVGCTATYTA